MNLHAVVAHGRAATTHTASGATARPLTRRQGGSVLLKAVQIDSTHPVHGHGVVYLTPDQVLEIQARLSQLAYEFLHENRWGGEDPFGQ